MPRTWIGTAKIGLAAVVLAVAGAPLGQLLAQQPGNDAAAAPGKVAAGTVDEARVQKGRTLFADWSCTSCHSLADAQSHSDIAPSLDGGELTEAFIIGRVSNGLGAMPSFAGQLTDEEIADIAYYITHVAKKG